MHGHSEAVARLRPERDMSDVNRSIVLGPHFQIQDSSVGVCTSWLLLDAGMRGNRVIGTRNTKLPALTENVVNDSVA